MGRLIRIGASFLSLVMKGAGGREVREKRTERGRGIEVEGVREGGRWERKEGGRE